MCRNSITSACEWGDSQTLVGTRSLIFAHTLTDGLGKSLLRVVRTLLHETAGIGNTRLPFILSMRTDEPRTIFEDCPRAEQRRRYQLDQIRLYCVLEINGESIARIPSSGSMALDIPSMLCKFDQVVTLQVVHRPEAINLKVYEAGRYAKGHAFGSPVLSHPLGSSEVRF